jgi:hypothetical protein
LLNLFASKEEEKGEGEDRIWKIVAGHNVDYTAIYS